jgi:hypothetical protein
MRLFSLAHFDRLHAGFGFLTCLESDGADLGHRRRRGFLVDDCAFLGRCILHDEVFRSCLSERIARKHSSQRRSNCESFRFLSPEVPFKNLVKSHPFHRLHRNDRDEADVGGPNSHSSLRGDLVRGKSRNSAIGAKRGSDCSCQFGSMVFSLVARERAWCIGRHASQQLIAHNARRGDGTSRAFVRTMQALDGTRTC